MSTSGTDEESSKAGAGNDEGNGTDSGKEIVSKAVTGCSEEKYRTDSKNVTTVDTIFLNGRNIDRYPF